MSDFSSISAYHTGHYGQTDPDGNLQIFAEVQAVIHPQYRHLVSDMEDAMAAVEEKTGVSIKFTKRRYVISGDWKQVETARDIMTEILQTQGSSVGSNEPSMIRASSSAHEMQLKDFDAPPRSMSFQGHGLINGWSKSSSSAGSRSTEAAKELGTRTSVGKKPTLSDSVLKDEQRPLKPSSKSDAIPKHIVENVEKWRTEVAENETRPGELPRERQDPNGQVDLEVTDSVQMDVTPSTFEAKQQGFLKVETQQLKQDLSQASPSGFPEFDPKNYMTQSDQINKDARIPRRSLDSREGTDDEISHDEGPPTLLGPDELPDEEVEETSNRVEDANDIKHGESSEDDTEPFQQQTAKLPKDTGSTPDDHDSCKSDADSDDESAFGEKILVDPMPWAYMQKVHKHHLNSLKENFEVSIRTKLDESTQCVTAIIAPLNQQKINLNDLYVVREQFTSIYQHVLLDCAEEVCQVPPEVPHPARSQACAVTMEKYPKIVLSETPKSSGRFVFVGPESMVKEARHLFMSDIGMQQGVRTRHRQPREHLDKAVIQKVLQESRNGPGLYTQHLQCAEARNMQEQTEIAMALGWQEQSYGYGEMLPAEHKPRPVLKLHKLPQSATASSTVMEGQQASTQRNDAPQGSLDYMYNDMPPLEPITPVDDKSHDLSLRNDEIHLTPDAVKSVGSHSEEYEGAQLLPTDKSVPKEEYDPKLSTGSAGEVLVAKKIPTETFSEMEEREELLQRENSGNEITEDGILTQKNISHHANQDRLEVDSPEHIIASFKPEIDVVDSSDEDDPEQAAAAGGSQGLVLPDDPAEVTVQADPDTTGPADPDTTDSADLDTRGPAGPDTRGPAYPDTRGPAGQDTTGPTYPDTRGPAGPDARGSAGPDTRGPAGQDTTGPTYPDTRGPAGPDARGSAGPDTRGPAYPDTRGPAGQDTRGPTYPDTRGPAGPDARGSADPDTTGPTGPHTRGPTYPDTRGPAGPDTTGPAYPDTTDPAGPHNRSPTYPDTRGPAGPDTTSKASRSHVVWLDDDSSDDDDLDPPQNAPGKAKNVPDVLEQIFMTKAEKMSEKAASVSTQRIYKNLQEGGEFSSKKLMNAVSEAIATSGTARLGQEENNVQPREINDEEDEDTVKEKPKFYPKMQKDGTVIQTCSANICTNCVTPMTGSAKLECGHEFCRDCIRNPTRISDICPTCGRKVNRVTLEQPEGGKLSHIIDKNIHLPRFPKAGTIMMTFQFESCNVQGADGSVSVQKATFVTYLPNTNDGRSVFKQLLDLYKSRGLFTISHVPGTRGVILSKDGIALSKDKASVTKEWISQLNRDLQRLLVE